MGTWGVEKHSSSNYLNMKPKDQQNWMEKSPKPPGLSIPAVETNVDPCLPPGKTQMQRAALEHMFHICPHAKNIL